MSARKFPSLRKMSPTPACYEGWTREELIARLTKLERPKHPTRNSHLPQKTFDFSKYPRRKIALKFCYSGWEYNGLASQSDPTPLPTVEQVLFDAFAHTRLVDPDGGFEGCEWERCGRTDRGVSAAGQVVSLFVRSALSGGDEAEVKTEDKRPDVSVDSGAASSEFPAFGTDLNLMGNLVESLAAPEASLRSSKSKCELAFVAILNRMLPPTIRVLAWSPVSPDFSARFSCQRRHYKYFFSPRGLDLSLMRNAAARLIGEHDFRNLCKLDPAKQITNFKRTILHASITHVSSTDNEEDESIYVFDLLGTAFLYHQVRHIMAVLFLVGTGLEHPSVISSL